MHASGTDQREAAAECHGTRAAVRRRAVGFNSTILLFELCNYIQAPSKRLRGTVAAAAAASPMMSAIRRRQEDGRRTTYNDGKRQAVRGQ
jgi:hypothetical protein